MKATLNQLRNAVGMGQNVGPLTVLAISPDLRIKTKFRIEHLWEKVSAELERAEKHRSEIVQRLAMSDDKTDEILRHPNGQAQFQNRATRERCETEIAELYALEVDLPGEMFDWDAFRTRPNAESLKAHNLLDDLSAIHYAAIRWFVSPRPADAEDDPEDDNDVLDLTEKSKTAGM